MASAWHPVLIQFLSESLLMSNNNSSTFKAAATVREVCRLVQLSTARFYELQQAGIFPMPVYDLRSRRPLYTEEQQRQCVEIKSTGRGFNGQAVIFYERRKPVSQPKRAANGTLTTSVPTTDKHEGVLAAVRSLGLAAATLAQVDGAVKNLFPGGIGGVDQGQVIRQVFISLTRQRAG